jgi:hypothetical protein
MELGKGSMALLAALCVGAGAGGAYFVTRTATSVEAPVSVADLIPTTLDSPTAPLPGAVQPRAVLATPPARPRPVAAPAPRATRSAEAPPPSHTTTGPVTSGEQSPAPLEPAQVAAPVEVPVTPAVAEVQPSRPVESPRPVEAPAVHLEELVVAADSVIGLEVETSVTSERARLEDAVVARVTRDVRVGDRVAIPAGSRAHGEVMLVERGGRMKNRARLGVRFTSIALPDGNRIAIRTDTVFRDDSPTVERNAKIGGGAIAGAIIGGILGGAKGAAIGGSAGAGAGTATVMTGPRSTATLPAGTPVTVRLQEPVTVVAER